MEDYGDKFISCLQPWYDYRGIKSAEPAEKSADSKNMNRSDLSARHKQILINMDIGVEYSTEQIAEKIY